MYTKITLVNSNTHEGCGVRRMAINFYTSYMILPYIQYSVRVLIEMSEYISLLVLILVLLASGANCRPGRGNRPANRSWEACVPAW